MFKPIAPGMFAGLVTNYMMLARKWRPSQFQDVVGQTNIIRTLMNAVEHERLHSAYLFTGSRGIGKTSIARIFAKVIRCEHTSRSEQGLRSCDECSNCKEIAAGASVDVIEIDGASNNGVDAVREIRENARYSPTHGKRKIYIIDEVHMLTTAAFNALLKTLEEPPAHVIFIFATTEPHKIPGTVLSRCQRFDFKRGTAAQLQNLLSKILSAESVTIEPAALALIARAADGGMRDALSLLDQVIAFSGKTITANDARESIGLIHSQAILKMLGGIFARQPGVALEVVHETWAHGYDLRVLTRSLVDYLHAAILMKVSAEPKLLLTTGLADDELTELKALSASRSIEELELIFQVFHHGVESMTRTSQPKVLLDILVIKCAAAEILSPVFSPAPTTSAPQTRVVPSGSTLTAPVAPSVPSIQGAPRPTVAAAAPIVAAPAVTPLATPTTAPAAVPASGPNWEGFISAVRAQRPLLASILEHGASDGSIELKGEVGVVTVQFRKQDAYFSDQLQSRLYTDQIAQIGKDYFGRVIRITPLLVDTADGPVKSVVERKEDQRRARETEILENARTHPMILEAKALFGADMGPIELSSSEGSDA